MIVLYVLVPLVDKMACADCVDNAHVCHETIVGHQPPLEKDLSFYEQGTSTANSDDPCHRSLCPLCANFVTFVCVSSLPVLVPLLQRDELPVLSPVLEYYSSIDKPPDNSIV
jgi:hypothetical protein